MSLTIFIGTDPCQHVAERVLRHSIEKHASGPVKIVPIGRVEFPDGRTDGKTLGQWWREDRWATPFSCHRFGVPELAGFQSVPVLYLDVDMLVLGDVYELLDHRRNAAWTVNKHLVDLAIIDPARFADADWWPSIEEMRASGWGMAEYTQLLRAHGAMVSGIPHAWNCLDGDGYVKGETRLVHFTQMNTQPWRPYPDIYYSPHPRSEIVKLWLRYEDESRA